ncbi:hypothetical protein MKW92_019117 [Papaver armeniacum]|nr:hypothetical protein MKW92_019117 [Papaver armeniacum]
MVVGLKHLVVIQTDYSTNHRSIYIDTEGIATLQNEKIELPLYHNVRFIRGAQYKTSSGAIGLFPPFYLHFLSYRLRDRNGEPNGIVNLRFEVIEPPRQYLAELP